MKRAAIAFMALLSAHAGAAGCRPAEAAVPERRFELSAPGSESVVDYTAYGRFEGAGTDGYRFVVEDEAGLAAAAGEGVWPNKTAVQNPFVRAFAAEHPSVEAWEFVGKDPAEMYAAWQLDPDKDEGTRLFYTAEALRRAGLLREALKAYRALVVHFPRTTVWSPDGTYYWYAAREAISLSRKICATYPELGIQLEGSLVLVERGGGLDPALDKVSVTPGEFRRVRLAPVDPASLRVVRTLGGGKAQAVQLENGHWQLRVDGKPFFVRGITYTCSTVGESPHALDLRPWMTLDDDRNGRNDGMFDSWIDADGDNRRGKNEKASGDAKLLADLGVNAIRYYHGQDSRGNYQPGEYDKPLMRRLARDYGIYFVMGDFLGAYTIGSGAAWEAGTDYTDPAQRRRMLAMVEAMVRDHKDEPYVLMWLLGNENQHRLSKTNAGDDPEAYARFVNEAAELIKSIDPEHPVAISQLNTFGLEQIARFAPSVDIYGANVYSGAYSMGSTVQAVKHHFDRPLLFTEWGTDAYFEGIGPDEEGQAAYIRANWTDIRLNRAGSTGEGNVIGGLLFEWMDEWWKSSKGDGWGSPKTQETAGDFHLPFPDGWAHEEWYGLMSQGDGSRSHFLRRPRKAYSVLKSLWDEERAGENER